MSYLHVTRNFVKNTGLSQQEKAVKSLELARSILKFRRFADNRLTLNPLFILVVVVVTVDKIVKAFAGQSMFPFQNE